MASITKRNGKWRVQIRRKGVSKSEQFRTKAEAIAWADEIETKIKNGSYNTGIPYMTFAEVIDKYIKEVSRHKKSYREERLRFIRLMDRHYQTSCFNQNARLRFNLSIKYKIP
ncbi:hypothetical protein BKG92_07225 [Rodentibacter ratti]|uniref:Integrase n=1 Tax=Rodentibacter ratti TaxID=1906745 RepID=A0A1V3KWT5_9PAST|nr:hypothetical protein BKG92_07225 [Rodentibacter ratti]